MKYLMITSDDYGMDPSVNRAAEACLRAGTALSVNVMANMPCAGDAAGLKKLNPLVSVGIHWTLTTGKPVLPPEQVPSLVDPSSGEFLSCRELRRRDGAGSWDRREALRELTAQYERYVELTGFAPDYWNTHENVHVSVSLFSLFRDRALALGIRKMRNHDRIVVAPSTRGDRSLRWRLTEPAKRLVLRRWERQGRRLGLRFPDGLLLFWQEADRFHPADFLERIEWGDRDFAELPIHPAIDGECRYFGDITQDRVTEYHLWADPGVAVRAREKGITLCNFDRLYPGQGACDYG